MATCGSRAWFCIQLTWQGQECPPARGPRIQLPTGMRALRKSVVSFSSPSHACLWAFHSPSIRPPLLKGPVRADRG